MRVSFHLKDAIFPHQSSEFSLLASSFFLFPILNEAILKSCSSIGIVERHQDKCVALLPVGRLIVANDNMSMHEVCNQYLANYDKTENRFTVWKIFQESDINIIASICTMQDPCLWDVYRSNYSYMFKDCNRDGLKAWLGFREPVFYSIFGIAECVNGSQTKRYYACSFSAGEIADQYQPTEMIIGSSFYSIPKLTPIDNAFLFEKLETISNYGPSILYFNW